MTETLTTVALSDLNVPALDTIQAQGDLTVIPWAEDVAPAVRARDIAAATPVPQPGVVVVQGQGGNTHLLIDPATADRDRTPVTWHRYRGEAQTVGVVIVPPGAVAFLDHAEHGRNAIAPGVYVIRRQREQADEIRMVAD